MFTKKIRYIFTLFLLGSVLISCATVYTATPNSSFKISDYKRAYIKKLSYDEWHLREAITYELNDLGINVVESSFETPTPEDLIVTFSYSSNWDMTQYLEEFKISFIDALSGEEVTSVFYSLEGIWAGARDSRLEHAFNDLRKNNNYPPTKQFQ